MPRYQLQQHLRLLGWNQSRRNTEKWWKISCKLFIRQFLPASIIHWKLLTSAEQATKKFSWKLIRDTSWWSGYGWCHNIQIRLLSIFAINTHFADTWITLAMPFIIVNPGYHWVFSAHLDNVVFLPLPFLLCSYYYKDTINAVMKTVHVLLITDCIHF